MSDTPTFPTSRDSEIAPTDYDAASVGGNSDVRHADVSNMSRFGDRSYRL